MYHLVQHFRSYKIFIYWVSCTCDC